MNKIIFIIFILICFISCGSEEEKSAEKALRNYNGNYVIVVSKKKFRLSVYQRGTGLVKVYKIGFGSNEDLAPKLYEGDNRTPEGSYYVNEMLSMDSDKNSGSYRKLKKMNEFYFRKDKGYHKFNMPDSDLGDNAYGPRFFGINYPDEIDSARYQAALSRGQIPVINGKPAGIGYGIAIHGNNDESSIGHPCSSGCIRMYNRDIVELENYISLSTPVIIQND